MDFQQGAPEQIANDVDWAGDGCLAMSGGNGMPERDAAQQESAEEQENHTKGAPALGEWTCIVVWDLLLSRE